MKVSTLHHSFTVGAQFRTISQMVLAAFEGRPSDLLSPADVIAWYEDAYGDLPYDPASVRGAMSSMAKNKKGKLVKREHGTYGLAAVHGLGTQSPTVDAAPAAPPGGLAIPTTRNGHGTGTGRDNSEPAAPTIFPEHQLRFMTGGNIPRYSDGSPRLTLSHAVGDSMAPYIPDGHPILYEPDAEFVDGARYAVWLGEAENDVVKRIQLGGKKSVTLVSDNPQVQPRTLWPTDDPEVWRDGNGDTIRMVVRGRVLFPFDTGPAVFGQLAEFARSLIRS